jgi:hypothetical protein
MLHECYIYMSWLLLYKGSINIYKNVTLGMYVFHHINRYGN